MDDADPRLLWYVVRLVALASTAAFALLHRRFKERLKSSTAPATVQ